MNLRKIVATAISAVMLFSAVSASASFYLDEGWQMTDAYPTVAEVSARQAVVTSAVEKISIDDAVALGISRGRGASAKTDDNTDCYKVIYTINNFGPLYYACYDDGAYDKYTFVKLFDATITIPSITAKGYVVSGSFNGKDFSSEAVNKLIWNAGSIAGEYPANSEEGTLSEDTTLTATVVYAVDKGYTLDVTPTLAVAYDVKTADGNPSVDATGVAANNLVFSSAPATTAVTGVTMAPKALNLKVGESGTVTGTVAPSDATDKTVTYSSSNTSVATVDASTGLVTAVAKGTATITVTTTDGGKTDTCAVTVAPADVVPAAADSKVVGNATTGLKDADGKSVTIDASRSYGAAKFDNVQIDAGDYIYKVVAKDSNGNEKEFDIADEYLEVSGKASFIAIVRSATHTIVSVVLKAFAK